MRREFFVGLDLGKRRDYAALAVMERMTRTEQVFDPVKYERKVLATVTYEVRWMRRLPLGTTYPEVVRRVRAVLGELAGQGEVQLVVDGTGLGEPVVDMLREENLPAAVTAVSITAGGMGAHKGDGRWHVARMDLLGGLRAMLERGEVKVAAEAPEADRLKRELGALRERRGRVDSAGGEHDDLAMAVALACWWGRMRRERVVEKGAYLPV